MRDIDLIRVVSGKNRTALRWAEIAHRGVNRKGREGDAAVPYLLHPIAVADALLASGADRNLVCAGCLHDVVEDSKITNDEIRIEFGDEVADLVEAVTKDSNLKQTKLENQAYLILAKLSEVGPTAFALKAADLLINISDLVLDAEVEGIEHFSRVFGEHRALRKIDHYLSLSWMLVNVLSFTQFHRLGHALELRTEELEEFRDEYSLLNEPIE